MNRGGQEFRDFRNAVKRAEAQAEEARLNTIIIAAKKNWTAAAWWLERKFPERWGRREAVNLNGKMRNENLNVQIGKGQLPTETELVELLKELIGEPDVIETTAKHVNGHLTNGNEQHRNGKTGSAPGPERRS